MTPGLLVTGDMIREALREVIDPELGENLVDLGLVYRVHIDGARVAVDLTLTTPGCPLHASLHAAAERSIRLMVAGVEDVQVQIVFEPRWTPDRMSGRSPSDPVWVAAGCLAIAGWAETPIQGFLYKIGTFLTWLHRYAPLAGRQPVPRPEDLYDRRIAVAGWATWTGGVAFGAAAALTGLALLAHIAAAGLSLGAILFLSNAIRVGAHWRSRSIGVPRAVGLSTGVIH